MTVSVKQPLKLKKKTSPSHQQRNSLVRRCESFAAQFLLSRGFQLLAQNVRVGRGELDLIFFDLDVQELVFVEVKTRSSFFAGDPGLAVDWRKLRALARSARQWMREIWRKDGAFRIDVIAIFPGKLKHYKNVTW